MIRVLFVCLGNICRSPTAEAVARKRINDDQLDWLEVDSAGTSAFHQGAQPDMRSMQEGLARGYSFERQTSRPVREDDFQDFDYILAMDSHNLRALRKMRDRCTYPRASLWLFMNETIGMTEMDMPDPYYDDGFENVLSLCEAGVQRWIDFLRPDAHA